MSTNKRYDETCPTCRELGEFVTGLTVGDDPKNLFVPARLIGSRSGEESRESIEKQVYEFLADPDLYNGDSDFSVNSAAQLAASFFLHKTNLDARHREERLLSTITGWIDKEPGAPPTPQSGTHDEELWNLADCGKHSGRTDGYDKTCHFCLARAEKIRNYARAQNRATPQSGENGVWRDGMAIFIGSLPAPVHIAKNEDDAKAWMDGVQLALEQFALSQNEKARLREERLRQLPALFDKKFSESGNMPFLGEAIRRWLEHEIERLLRGEWTR